MATEIMEHKPGDRLSELLLAAHKTQTYGEAPVHGMMREDFDNWGERLAPQAMAALASTALEPDARSGAVPGYRGGDGEADAAAGLLSPAAAGCPA